MTAPLWQPSEARIADAKLTAFLARLRQERGLDFKDYDDLYDWSVTDLEGFWTAVWDFCGVIADPERGRAVVDADKMRSEEHTSELQSLMRISYAVFCLKKKNDKAP